MRFYDFDGTMYFYRFGRKLRFYWFGRKVVWPESDFYKKNAFFFFFAEKRIFAVLAEKIVFKFWRENAFFGSGGKMYMQKIEFLV